MKKGIDFFVVGDYGCIDAMNPAYMTFNKMEEIAANPKSDRDLIDFMVTVGDNLYASGPDYHEPPMWQWLEMISLFNKTTLKNLMVYAVRGNHDCDFRWDREIELMETYDKWYMPSLYYKTEHDIGNGKKLGILHVDSNIMLCSTYSYEDDKQTFGENFHRLMDVNCEWPELAAEFGNAQYDWIKQTMEEWDKDPNMIWKLTALHHPLWGKWYIDYVPLVKNYLPLLMKHKFDVFLCGHEHTTVHAFYPYDQVSQHQIKEESEQQTHSLKDVQCDHEITLRFDDKYTNRVFTKGEVLTQITTGTTGNDKYPICPRVPSMGRFSFA